MFSEEIHDFTNSMDAIRGFVDSLEPVLIKRIDENFEANSENLGILLLALQDLSSTTEDSQSFSLPEETKKKIKEDFKGDFEFIIENGNINIKTVGEDAFKFGIAINTYKTLNQQKKLLYKSSLMSIISTVEGFLASMLHKYFKTYSTEISPALIIKKDKQFSLSELESFKDIEDAKNYIVETKIENLIRCSFTEWIIFFKEKLSLSMGYLKDQEDVLNEIFQRRNVVVHNQGIVNSIYLAKVAEQFRKGVEKGETIDLSRPYLDSVINKLEFNFALIALELWKKRVAKDNNRANLLTGIISEHVVEKRWDIIKGYSTFLMNDSKCSQVDKTFATVNYWLACKRNGEFEQIKDKISSEDFSAYTLDFQICKAALLNKNEEVLTKMSKALDQGIFGIADVKVWPIFDEIREEDKYLQLIQKWENKTDDNSTVA